MGLQEDTGQDVFRTFNGAIKTAEEPFQPGSYVQASFLGLFECIVMGFAL